MLLRKLPAAGAMIRLILRDQHGARVPGGTRGAMKSSAGLRESTR